MWIVSWRKEFDNPSYIVSHLFLIHIVILCWIVYGYASELWTFCKNPYLILSRLDLALSDVDWPVWIIDWFEGTRDGKLSRRWGLASESLLVLSILRLVLISTRMKGKWFENDSGAIQKSKNRRGSEMGNLVRKGLLPKPRLFEYFSAKNKTSISSCSMTITSDKFILQAMEEIVKARSAIRRLTMEFLALMQVIPPYYVIFLNSHV